jgi:hypothetical protein
MSSYLRAFAAILSFAWDALPPENYMAHSLLSIQMPFLGVIL